MKKLIVELLKLIFCMMQLALVITTFYFVLFYKEKE